MKTKKILSIVLTLCMLLSIVSTMSFTASAVEPISYIVPVYVDESDATKGISGTTTALCSDYTSVTTSDTEWGTAGTEKWFVVDGTFSIENTVAVNGDVNLILANDANLEITSSDSDAISISKGSSLTIYEQSGTGTKGKLTVNGGEGGIYYGHVYWHLGKDGILCDGNLTINGGTVEANGYTLNCDEEDEGDSGVGIEFSIYSAGKLIINGGTVIANGGDASANDYIMAGAGIVHVGDSKEPANGIIINGGNVTGNGGKGVGEFSSGGGGISSDSIFIINAGNVTGNGGDATEVGSAGGSGISGYFNINGGTITAIGGNAGEGGTGGVGLTTVYTLTINGGTVTATGGNSGYNSGTGITGDDGFIISGGTVTATGGNTTTTDETVLCSKGIDVNYSSYGTDGCFITGGVVTASSGQINGVMKSDGINITGSKLTITGGTVEAFGIRDTSGNASHNAITTFSGLYISKTMLISAWMSVEGTFLAYYGTQRDLGQDLSVSYHVKIEPRSNLPEKVRAAEFYTSLTLNESIDVNLNIKGLASDYVTNDLIVTVDGTPVTMTKSGTTATGVLRNVAPKDIGKDFYVVVTYEGKVVHAFRYNPATYCYNVWRTYNKYASNTPEGKLVALCESLGGYGKYAEAYFNKKDYDEGKISVLPPISGDISRLHIATLVAPSESNKNIVISDNITAAGASLGIDSTISMNFYVQSSKPITADDVVICNNILVKENVYQKVDSKYIEVTASDVAGYNYKISINNIYAEQMSREYTLTIVGDNTFSATYGVYDYCYEAQTQFAGNENLTSLCKAIYVYGSAAKAFSDSISA